MKLNLGNTVLLSMISTILLIVGGVNLGLEGLLAVNLIQSIFGNLLMRLIYIIIGLSAAYLILVKIKNRNPAA